jgi:hypothetical protein
MQVGDLRGNVAAVEGVPRSIDAGSAAARFGGGFLIRHESQRRGKLMHFARRASIARLAGIDRSYSIRLLGNRCHINFHASGPDLPLRLRQSKIDHRCMGNAESQRRSPRRYAAAAF